MARIRTIKPEFPQSESMGRISREARLLFIMLWTLADDSGRLRGNSRMLASLLYPYDEDAPSLIDGWLAELDEEDCIRMYLFSNHTYLQICNWLNHQKIDKPTKSKIPEFDESSRILANPRESSSEDQGSKDQRTKDKGSKDLSACDKSHACPHQEIINLYNSILPELQRVIPERWDGTRRTYLSSRWKESPKHQKLEFWERFFKTLRNYPFYMGNNDRGWKPTLAWLIEKKHFDDLLEKFISDNQKANAA